jgi:oxygen-independent coproporphyrinogen-3 oxidase
LISFSSLPELSLYVHLPWCIRKCPYCDFNSHEQRGDIPEDAYLAALIQDLESSLPLIWGRPLVSVFIGGGTPSLFSAESIARLLSEIRARVRLLPGAEITMEANPGSFEADRFTGFAQAGVNRLSLGVQSFQGHQLETLGRVHNPEQAFHAAEHAVKVFPRVNLDLMFGLPGQTLRELETEIDQAVALGSEHLSMYQLTLEPNTQFAVRPPPNLPDDDQLADMQQLVVERLAKAGFERYEISAYARRGAQAQHNLNYWTFGDYLGIGAGAHGKISSAHGIVRTLKPRTPALYMSDPSEAKTESVQVDDLPFEFMLNALRLTQGVAVSRWSQTTGMSVGQHPWLLGALAKAQASGLMAQEPGRFAATPRGLDMLTNLQSFFLRG